MITPGKYLFLASIIAALSISCESPTSIQNKPAQVAFIDFEEDAELNNWNLGSKWGHTSFDTETKFAGKRSIHFSPDSGCYVIDRKTGINVQSGKKYSITFNTIVNDPQVGKRTYCAGQFILTIKQGNEEILYASVFDAPDWEEKTFYFLPKNDLPVNLNLIIGDDVWIDDISIVREIQ
ncbi:MAG TPA: hypothetical protein VHO70_03295 [Chitinispirillaceae bacterium]|nr:hypothetical protein [Chitinispirillaceae bacterium]